MTEENKRANIQDELARSREAKASAELLFEHGQIRDAVSRLYYCVFYAMRALLLTRALQPRSQEGTLNLFSLHFVHPGLFQPGDAHTFSRLQKYRHEADYASGNVFTPSDYLEFSREAEQLLAKIETHIKTDGYLQR